MILMCPEIVDTLMLMEKCLIIVSLYELFSLFIHFMGASMNIITHTETQTRIIWPIKC